jgi:hypothetical protein
MARKRNLNHDEYREWFFSQVTVSGDCWIWNLAKDKDGYGVTSINQIYKKAHRVSFELNSGKQIESKNIVCHKCDNPPCVNPAHLFLGTHRDNVLDMFSKKRNHPRYGEFHPGRKLSEADIFEIRNRYSLKLRNGGQLAREFGVAPTTIWRAVNRVRWGHI